MPLKPVVLVFIHFSISLSGAPIRIMTTFHLLGSECEIILALGLMTHSR